MKYHCSKDQHLPTVMMSYQWKYPKNWVLPKRSFIPGYPVNAGAKVLGIFSDKCFLPHSQNFTLFKISFLHFHVESMNRSFGGQKKVGTMKLIAAALISSLNTAKGADLLNPHSDWEYVTHLCSLGSNEKGGNVTFAENAWRANVQALTGSVEGKRAARRQLPGSQCATSQETVLHLCQGRLRYPLFLLFPNHLCLVLCATTAADKSRRKLNWEKLGPLPLRQVKGSVRSLCSWQVSIASSTSHTSW